MENKKIIYYINGGKEYKDLGKFVFILGISSYISFPYFEKLLFNIENLIIKKTFSQEIIENILTKIINIIN